MLPEHVEGICPNLTPLLKNTIRTKILNKTKPPTSYVYGEALAFWLADLLLTTKLVTPEQLRLILEELASRLLEFGAALEAADANKHTPYPVCKIGFLDRKFVCLDKCPFFLNIKTGEREETTTYAPMETIAYNLTVVFNHYKYKMNSQPRPIDPSNPNGIRRFTVPNNSTVQRK